LPNSPKKTPAAAQGSTAAFGPGACFELAPPPWTAIIVQQKSAIVVCLCGGGSDLSGLKIPQQANGAAAVAIREPVPVLRMSVVSDTSLVLR